MDTALKRFTATDKWDDKWFRALSPKTKLLWLYLLDHCDNAGVVDPDLILASFQIGDTVNESNISELGDRVQTLANGKLWLHKFIRFQFGELSAGSKVHQSVIRLIKSHTLDYRIPYDTDSQETGMGDVSPKEKRKEKDKDIYSPDCRAALHWLNEKSNKHFRETNENLGFISARLAEPGVTIEGVKKMVDRQCKLWLGTMQQEYLRPQTLFNKTKFDSYYAAKDLPINENHERPNGQRIDRSIGTANEGLADKYKGLGRVPKV